MKTFILISAMVAFTFLMSVWVNNQPLNDMQIAPGPISHRPDQPCRACIEETQAIERLFAQHGDIMTIDGHRIWTSRAWTNPYNPELIDINKRNQEIIRTDMQRNHPPVSVGGLTK